MHPIDHKHAINAIPVKKHRPICGTVARRFVNGVEIGTMMTKRRDR